MSVLSAASGASVAQPVVINRQPSIARATRWSRLVGVGDSVIAGIGDAVPGYPDISWMDQLAARLGDHVAYTNLGVVGLRAAAIRETQLQRALDLQPDLVVLSAGGNDMFAPDFDPGAVAADLDALIGAFRATGADVVTFGFFQIAHLLDVPAATRERLADRNRVLAALTAEAGKRYGAIHIDNSHRWIDPALMSADGIHFNRRGQAMLAAVIAVVLGLPA